MHALIQLHEGTLKTFPLSWPMKSKVKQNTQNLSAITGHIHLRIIQMLRPPQNFCSDEGSQDCASEPRSLNITQLWREQRAPDRCGWYSLELYREQSM